MAFSLTERGICHLKVIIFPWRSYSKINDEMKSKIVNEKTAIYAISEFNIFVGIIMTITMVIDSVKDKIKSVIIQQQGPEKAK